MPTLSLLGFDEASQAMAAVPVVEDAERSGALALDDAALITWLPASPRPTLRRLAELRSADPYSEQFWQLLLSSVLLLPIAVRALGGAASEDTVSLAALGIEERFVRTVRSHLVPDTSGLVLLTRDATADRVVRALRKLDFTLLSTQLSIRQQGALMAGFGGAEQIGTPAKGRT